MNEQAPQEIVSMEALDNIQDEIAYLKRRIWETDAPSRKYMFYFDLITAALQVIEDTKFRARIKSKLDQLKFDEQTYWNYIKRGYPQRVVEQFLYAQRLSDIVDIWEQVVQPLRELSIISDRPKTIDELVNDAVEQWIEDGILEGEVEEDAGKSTKS
jgi:phosphoenolpyruvate-protein kinase (PTS system EI component)